MIRINDYHKEDINEITQTSDVSGHVSSGLDMPKDACVCCKCGVAIPREGRECSLIPCPNCGSRMERKVSK